MTSDVTIEFNFHAWVTYSSFYYNYNIVIPINCNYLIVPDSINLPPAEYAIIIYET